MKSFKHHYFYYPFFMLLTVFFLFFSGTIVSAAVKTSDLETVPWSKAVGGIHGRNRLMGNSLLDIIVFGRNAGKAAAAKAKETELGTLTLKHIEDYAEELKSAGIESEDVSPLLLPHYARHER